MSAISIFDIFKIGIGPSSSHTLGPWNAATIFAERLKNLEFDRVNIHLYGSLSKTGIGHATDQAIVLGLMGYSPKTIDTNLISEYLFSLRDKEEITILGKTITFQFEKDIIFEQIEHALHPNTLKFVAYANQEQVKAQIFASVGGGFIEYDQSDEVPLSLKGFPYPITCGLDILKYTKKENCKISDIVYKNELTLRSAREIDIQIDLIMSTMLSAMYEGCCTGGILPGGLQVKRRAKDLCTRLLNGVPYESQEDWIKAIRNAPKDFNSVNKWISCFALAVNEHNAAMGRVVTSPTNGAAGVIPTVLMYYFLFCNYEGNEQIKKFLFTAGEIGCLFVKGATISAAVGGCQAEIGVSSAMAAGALTEVLGGTPEQCLMAAEIAMEHHLGLTCDPIKGLVQVPCIERNTMGAIKAITASNLALESDASTAIVPLDSVIKTMWEVAQDMNSKYKETSEGGLAISLPVINPYC